MEIRRDADASPAVTGDGAGRQGRAVAWLVLGMVAGVAGAFAIVVVLVSAMAAPSAMDHPRFVEEAAAAGIDHVYDGEFTFFVGGGVAVFDCDDDARPDLYFAGGSNPASLYRNESPTGGSIRFAALADPTSALTEVTGAYPLDVDSDGVVDLAVLRFGENILLRGLGDCRFERANEAWSVDGGVDWTVAFSAKWEGTESHPTLAFGNYVALDEDGRQAGCSDHFLFRPEGEAYGPPVKLSPGWCTLSILFSDWDRTGRRDLRMTNDRHYYLDGEEQMWRVAEGAPPRLYTAEEGWQTIRIWGMGIASHDLTGDGLPEVYLTSQADNKLQTLTNGPGEPNYRDIALSRGATVHRPYTGDVALPSTAWHPEFADVNNDGFIDLFVSKGNVDAQPDFARQDPSNLLLGQGDGTFVEAAEAAGIVNFARGRGAALVDLNLDGMLDLVEVNRREPVEVWRSIGWGDPDRPVAMGNWIAVRLEQAGPNRDAVGSWVEVRAGDGVQERETTVGGGHAGGQLGWIHFGLGAASNVELRVQWPDGEVGPWLDVGANRFVTVERGRAEAVVWEPTGD
jgi:hypothetical protein